jgi:squalene synthase HpnC
MVDLDVAYDACFRYGRGHYENFPVASWFLPRPMRRHVAAVYAFARAGDDFADEGNRTVDERHRLLDVWLQRLRRTASAPDAPTGAPEPGEPTDAREVFLALGATMRACALPVILFEDLLSAFRQDVTVKRYETWADLRDYCRRSANPIGRLVLRIGGYREPQLDRWSDAVCTALQLTNFWQDLAPDFARGRIYLPAEEIGRHQADERALVQGDMTPEWAGALRAAVRRTRELFNEGRPLCDRIRGRLRHELRATWLGGVRILDRIDANPRDLVRGRPTIGAADAPWLLAWLLAWPLGPRATRAER